MLRFLLDTDHLTLFDHSDIVVWRRFIQRAPGDVGVAVASVEERSGVDLIDSRPFLLSTKG
jgi:hypothetical protein